jgi:hypothetical protein
MDNLRQGLEQIVNAIEELANEPAPKPKFIQNELSGDIIHGGTITKFSSTGIADESTQRVVLVNDKGLHTDSLTVSNVLNEVTFDKDVHVNGELYATKLHVNELSADVRNERSSPLEFIADDSGLYGKGLIWRQENVVSKQLVFKPNPDRFYSTETIDVDRSAAYSIGNAVVLTINELGPSVRSSNLSKVGVLNNLRTSGNLEIDEFVFYNSDNQRIGIGTDAPNANISLTSYETEFIIDVEGSSTKLGNWTTDGLDIVTDNTTRISISANGQVSVGNKEANNAKMNIFGSLGVGVNNVAEDVDLSVKNTLEIGGKKIFTTDSVPQAGIFKKGDIAYNSDPKPTGYVGWICIKDGTPGEWKPFGKISS